MTSKACHNFKINQTGCKPVCNGVNAVGKILDKLVGNSVWPVNQIEHLKACPDVIKALKR